MKSNPFSHWILALELPLVAGLVAGGVLSDQVLPYAAGATVLFWPLRRLLAGHFTRRTPADLPVTLLVLCLPVTLWATALPETTWPQALRLLGGIGLYYAMVNGMAGSARAGRLYRPWATLLLLAVGLAAAAPFSVSWNITKLALIPAEVYARFSIVVKDTVHPNVMAGSLALLAPLPAAGLLFAGQRLRRPVMLLAWLSFLASAVVILLAQSRGAWVAVGAALLLLGILRWGWAGLALGSAVGVGAAAVFGLGWLPGLAGAAFGDDSAAAAGDLLSSTVTTWEGREAIWSRAVAMVQDFAFTGAGMGSFGPVAEALYPFSYLAEPGSVPHAHNLFLQVAVDLGLPGLVAWLAVLLLSLQAAWQVYRAGRRAGDGFTAGLGAGLLASTVALVLHGLFDAVTWGMVRPAPLVWALWGLAMAAANAVREGALPGFSEAGRPGGIGMG